MFSQDVYSHYRLRVDERTSYLHSYRAFSSQGWTFLFVPVEDHQHESLTEVANMAYYMRKAGETGVLLPVLNTNQRYESEVDGGKVVLYQCPQPSQSRRRHPAGSELAQFHSHSSGFPFSELRGARYAAWQDLWGQRIDALEKWRDQINEKKEKDVFDDMFVSSFPYYLGLTENAIQYAVDTSLERDSVEMAAICHHRFYPYSWYYDGDAPLKIPSEWVVDHPSRDLAEWIRYTVWTDGMNREEISGFLQEYEQVKPLSRTGKRLLYARLLFPLVYLETVEGYYRAPSNEKRNAFSYQLQDVLEQANQNEQFLQRLHKAEEKNLPAVDWLY